MLEHKNREPIKPEKIVIVGGTGFLGQYLKLNFEESGIDASFYSSSDLDLTSNDAHIKLKSLVDEKDTLLVLAALTPDRGRDAITMMKNIEMVIQIGKFLEENICGHLILVSSDAVYSDDLSLIDEESNTSPGSLYGTGHFTREKILAEVCDRRNIPFLCLRPCALFGAGDTHNSYGPNRFIRQALGEGKISYFGEGSDTRDHLYVKDAAELIKFAILKKTTGLVNLASGQSRPFINVIETIKSHIPDPLELDPKPQSSPVSYRQFDITILEKAFPEVSFTDFKSAIAETIKIW